MVHPRCQFICSETLAPRELPGTFLHLLVDRQQHRSRPHFLDRLFCDGASLLLPGAPSSPKTGRPTTATCRGSARRRTWKKRRRVWFWKAPLRSFWQEAGDERGGCALARAALEASWRRKNAVYQSWCKERMHQYYIGS